MENIEGKVDERRMEEISGSLKKIILEASYSGITKEDFIDLTLKIFSQLGVDNNDKSK